MEQQLAGGTRPERETIQPKSKGKNNGWLVVSVGLILLAFLSNGKQPLNGTKQGPKSTQPETQALMPEPKVKIGRLLAYSSLAVIVGFVGIILQLVSAFAQAVPGQSDTPIVTNAITGVVVSLIALALYTDGVNLKANPRVMKVVGICLAFFALAQAIMALFLHLWGN